MRHRGLAFAGWPGGARSVAPELFRKRDLEVRRQLAFLLPLVTPRTVFMEIGSPDGELALQAAGYVERVWCVDGASRVRRAPCNLCYGAPREGVDVAFSETAKHPARIRGLLKPGAVWIVYGELAQEHLLRRAGFSSVAYYAAGLRLPRALARLLRNPVTAAYA
jgi:hypothetical protein